MQRGVQQPNGDRAVADGPQQLTEVFALSLGQRDERRRLLVGAVRHQHALDERQPVTQELVLRTAQPDALGAEGQADAGLARVVGIDPHAQPAHVVSPVQHRGQRRRRARQPGCRPRPRRVRRPNRRSRPVSPSRSSLPPVTAVAPSTIARPCTPQMAGRPMPRATTAAWDADPPLLVTMPTEASMPGTSAGEVSWASSTTRAPASASSSGPFTAEDHLAGGGSWGGRDAVGKHLLVAR